MTHMHDTAIQDLHRALASAGISCLRREPMSRHTTFRIGGEAALVAQPRSVAELTEVLRLHRASAGTLPMCILGNGSNVLFSDSGFAGLVILTGQVRSVHFSDTPDTDGRVRVTADGGASLTALADACVRDGRALDGLSFAYGIPGTVGGGVVMNAGAYGGELSDVTVGCTYFDRVTGEVCRLSADRLDFSYRHSVFSDHPSRVVLTVDMTLLPATEPSAVADIRTRMEACMTARRQKQPLEYPSAGSVFKRPEGAFAGKLIEDCGLKGCTVGGAQVSDKHAGFIVNLGHATAADVRTLIEHIQKTVYDACGVRLECEIRMIGT